MASMKKNKIESTHCRLEHTKLSCSLQMFHSENEFITRLSEEKKRFHFYTFTALNSVRSYNLSNSALISPRSISERLTMILINVVSFVPNPFIAAYKRFAKNACGDCMYSTRHFSLVKIN